MAELQTVRVKLDDGALAPTRAHDIDAGADLFTPHALVVTARGSAKVDTGVHMEIPAGYAGFLKSKSGLNVKHGIISDGTIDAGYTGSIVVKLYNLSDAPYRFRAGDKVTQIVIQSVETPTFDFVESIEGGERGDAGFGSSGK